MQPPKPFDEIAENLAFLEDWEDRYRYIIELGQDLPPLPPEDHSPENKVSGCASQVWLRSRPEQRDGKLVLDLAGDSDALIVKGLVAVLIALYSGRPAAEIAQTDAVAVFDEIGLREHLSTQRANGLASMVSRIRSEARAAAP